ncbi:hypothetical protein RIF29_30425 [Crotalaria pallida]|uniref:DUF4283 domain-containing protein n=1 Tax=Crotalaria pallida TaxID=3830 RepID=A0AAN9EIH9_CROPI
MEESRWAGNDRQRDRVSVQAEKEKVVSCAAEELPKLERKTSGVGSVIPLGGNMMILAPKDDGDISLTIKHDSKWFAGFFDDVEPWSRNVRINERLCWVQCFGIPVLVWSQKLFREIAAKVGTVMLIDEDTKNFSRLDKGRVLISTSSMTHIDSVMNIIVEGELFEVRIIEEVPGYCTNKASVNFLESDYMSSSELEDRWVEECNVELFGEEEIADDDVEEDFQI